MFRNRYHIIPGSTCPSKAGSSDCFTWRTVTEYISTLGTTYMEGIALDGFPLFATVKNNAVMLENNLDECGAKVDTRIKSYKADVISFLWRIQEEGAPTS